MTAPRLVFDTNVVISALIFRGPLSREIREIWRIRKAIPLIDRSTTTELLRVLSYPKFGLSSTERNEVLAEYLPWCEAVLSPRKRPEPPTCRDPKDQKFLELALVAKADGLVTGDADLLTLAPAFSIPIITPAALRTFLK
jgi:putative PIN family toxin of toxin-antitoxin system